MGKLLRVRDKLIFGLAITSDVFDEIRTVGGFVGYAYKQMYGFVPSNYKKSNLYGTVNRMLRSDLIERVVVGGVPKFKLSSVGFKHFKREFPLYILQNRMWDRKWRIVIFDIPEDKRYIRDRLRIKLKELGFGMIQKSVWISAYPFEDDVRDFLEAKNLEMEVYLFLSDSSFFGDVTNLIESVWGIEEINESYKKIISTFKKSANKKKFLDEYLQLLTEDPFLPKEFLPDNWNGDNARQLFKKLTRKYI